MQFNYDSIDWNSIKEPELPTLLQEILTTVFPQLEPKVTWEPSPLKTNYKITIFYVRFNQDILPLKYNVNLVRLPKFTIGQQFKVVVLTAINSIGEMLNENTSGNRRPDLQGSGDNQEVTASCC